MEIKLPGILQAEFLAQSPRLTTPHLLSPLGLQDHFLPFPQDLSKDSQSEEVLTKPLKCPGSQSLLSNLGAGTKEFLLCVHTLLCSLQLLFGALLTVPPLVQPPHTQLPLIHPAA